MKNKLIAIGTISVFIGVLLATLAVLIYLLIGMAKDVWHILINPSRLANLAKEFLESMGYLGLCCTGMVLLMIVIGKIPQKWWHGGMESGNDDDDDPYYRYM